MSESRIAILIRRMYGRMGRGISGYPPVSNVQDIPHGLGTISGGAPNSLVILQLAVGIHSVGHSPQGYPPISGRGANMVKWANW